MNALMAFTADKLMLATEPGSYQMGKAKLTNYHIPSSSCIPSPCLLSLYPLAVAYSVVATLSVVDLVTVYMALVSGAIAEGWMC